MGIYTKKTRTGDVTALLPLADVKRALQILDDNDDDEIQDIIFAAFDTAENYTKRCLTTTDVIAVRDDNVSEFFLPYGENVVFTSVKVDGSVTTDYSYNQVSGKFRINKSYSELEITYTCGFTELPKQVDRGIKFLVSTILNSGQDFVSGMDVKELPLRAVKLLDGVKYHVI